MGNFLTIPRWSPREKQPEITKMSDNNNNNNEHLEQDDEMIEIIYESQSGSIGVMDIESLDDANDISCPEIAMSLQSPPNSSYDGEDARLSAADENTLCMSFESAFVVYKDANSMDTDKSEETMVEESTTEKSEESTNQSGVSQFVPMKFNSQINASNGKELNKSLLCCDCGFLATDPTDLEIHSCCTVQTVSVERPFLCFRCGFQTQSVSIAENHIKTCLPFEGNENGWFPFLCDACGCRCVTADEMLNHETCRRDSVDGHLCSSCGFLSYDRSIAQSHEKICTGCDNNGQEICKRKLEDAIDALALDEKKLKFSSSQPSNNSVAVEMTEGIVEESTPAVNEASTAAGTRMENETEDGKRENETEDGKRENETEDGKRENVGGNVIEVEPTTETNPQQTPLETDFINQPSTSSVVAMVSTEVQTEKMNLSMSLKQMKRKLPTEGEEIEDGPTPCKVDIASQVNLHPTINFPELSADQSNLCNVVANLLCMTFTRMINENQGRVVGCCSGNESAIPECAGHCHRICCNREESVSQTDFKNCKRNKSLVVPKDPCAQPEMESKVRTSTPINEDSAADRNTQTQPLSCSPLNCNLKTEFFDFNRENEHLDHHHYNSAMVDSLPGCSQISKPPVAKRRRGRPPKSTVVTRGNLKQLPLGSSGEKKKNSDEYLPSSQPTNATTPLRVMTRVVKKPVPYSPELGSGKAGSDTVSSVGTVLQQSPLNSVKCNKFIKDLKFLDSSGSDDDDDDLPPVNFRS